MSKILTILLALFLLHTSVQAADRIRIGFPDLATPFVPLPSDKEVKFLATGPLDSRFAAMKQGLTAATLGSPPTDFLSKKMGFVVLARAHELFSYPISGIVASVKKIKERPDEVKRVIKAGVKANRYIRGSAK